MRWEELETWEDSNILQDSRRKIGRTSKWMHQCFHSLNSRAPHPSFPNLVSWQTSPSPVVFLSYWRRPYNLSERWSPESHRWSVFNYRREYFPIVNVVSSFPQKTKGLPCIGCGPCAKQSHNHFIPHLKSAITLWYKQHYFPISQIRKLRPTEVI